MSSNPFNYTDYGGGDHQTAFQASVWLFGCWSKSVGADLACSSTGCMAALSVTRKRHCSCGTYVACAVSVIRLCLASPHVTPHSPPSFLAVLQPFFCDQNKWIPKSTVNRSNPVHGRIHYWYTTTTPTIFYTTSNRGRSCSLSRSFVVIIVGRLNRRTVICFLLPSLVSISLRFAHFHFQILRFISVYCIVSCAPRFCREVGDI